MKCVVIEKPGVIGYTERNLPELAKDFVRVKVMSVAICATDLEVIKGNIPANYPLIPGHEWSGIVTESQNSAYNRLIGKRVTGSNDVSCGVCEACRSGNWRYCRDFEEIGFRRNGAYAQYIDVPAYGIVELPDSLSFDEAALAEPLGVALGTFEKIEAKSGKTCLIFGAGSIGLCCLAVAKSMGMRKISVVASSNKRLGKAKEIGADYVFASSDDLIERVKEIYPDGCDYVIEATGIESCIQNSLKLCRKGGYVALAGYGRGKTMSIRMDDIHINNLHVVGAGNNWNQHKKAIEMMADGRADMKPFISEILPLSQFESGLLKVETRPSGFVKVILKPDEE